MYSKLILFFLLTTSQAAFAFDSYRYLHVSLDSIWYIFIGLLMVILFPFVLMAWLAWYYSGKKKQAEE